MAQPQIVAKIANIASFKVFKNHEWHWGRISSRRALGTLGRLIWSPKIAYDFAADYYDNWIWQQIWQKVECPVVLSFATSNRSPINLLDVGIGTGTYAQKVLQKFSNTKIHGIDVSGRMLIRAKGKLGDKANLLIASALDIPHEDEKFDTVLMTRVGSHIENVDAVASELARVLKPGGVLVISDLSPSHNYSHTRLPSLFGRICVATFKHSEEAWKNSLRLHKLHLVSRKDIRRIDVICSGIPSLPKSIVNYNNRDTAYVLKFEKSPSGLN